MTLVTKTQLTMDQLVKAANQRISELRIRPSHHKARSRLTARTVRYYLQNGYIPEAIRASGQLRFTDQHVRAIVKLKSLQADGLLLKDTIQEPTVIKNPIDFGEKKMLIKSSRTQNIQSDEWTLKISDEISLVGTGTSPTSEDLANLKPFIQFWHENHLLRKSKR